MQSLFYPLEKAGIHNPRYVYYNAVVSQLLEEAIKREEGIFTSTGAFNVLTGKYTGRSPEDRYIVDDEITHNSIDWGKINVPIEPEKFNRLHGKLCAYLQGRDIFVYDGFVGVDPQCRLAVRFINEYAYQTVFVENMFLEATREELTNFKPEFTVICAPNFKADPEEDGIRSEAFVIINFQEKMVII